MTTAIIPAAASTSTSTKEEDKHTAGDDTSELSPFEYVFDASPRLGFGSTELLIKQPIAASWELAGESGWTARSASGWLVMQYVQPSESRVKPYEIHLSRTSHHGSIPLSVYLHTTLPDIQRASAPGQYEWRDRFKQLRTWYGNAEQGEAREVSTEALDEAELFCLYAERRLESQLLNIPTVLAPLSSGGIHMEWTDRGPTWDHLEIGIPAEPADRFELLRTEETPDGRTLSAQEVYDATFGEVLVSLERFINRAKQRR